MRKTATLAAVLAFALGLCFALQPDAQMIPRPTDSGPFNFTDLQRLLHRCPARTVIVDSAFVFAGTRTNWPGCMYNDLSDAIAHVATQTPAPQSPWTVLLMPGASGASGADPSNYIEAGNIVIPAHVTLQGFSMGGSGLTASVSSFPFLKLTCPSGTCLKLGGGAAINHLIIKYAGAPTAAVKVIEFDNTSTGSTQAEQITDSVLTVVPTNTTFVVDGITNTIASSYLYNVDVTLTGGNTGNRALVNTDTVAGRGMSVYGGRLTGATSCTSLVVNSAASGAGFQFFDTRIDPKCTTDFVNTGTGTFNVKDTPFTSSSGAIAAYGQIFSLSAASNPAACTVGQMYLNTTTPAVCLCTAANTWKCATLS